MGKIAVFDIGGTKIKAGVFLQGKGLVESTLFPTKAQEGGEAVLQKVQQQINQFQEKHVLTGIGIATAGQVDFATGVILSANENLPEYAGLNIKKHLEHIFGLPVVVDNDLNCALFAELDIPSNQQGTTVMVAIGTGIGSALAINGILYRGRHFRAGEIGYMPMGNSTFEKQASLSYLVAACQKLLPKKELTGQDVFKYGETIPEIAQLISGFFDTLARGLVSPVLMLDADRLILGGGVAERKDFLDYLMPSMNKYLSVDILKDLQIITAKSGNHSGLLGAAKLWLKTYETQK